MRITTTVEFAKEMAKVVAIAMMEILAPLIVAMSCQELVFTNQLSVNLTITCAQVTFGELFFSLNKSVNGQCPYPVIPCDDGNSCTNSVCHPSIGCSHSPVCLKVISDKRYAVTMVTLAPLILLVSMEHVLHQFPWIAVEPTAPLRILGSVFHFSLLASQVNVIHSKKENASQFR